MSSIEPRTSKTECKWRWGAHSSASFLDFQMLTLEFDHTRCVIWPGTMKHFAFVQFTIINGHPWKWLHFDAQNSWPCLHSCLHNQQGSALCSSHTGSQQHLFWKGIFLSLWWEQNVRYLLLPRDSTTFSETWVLTCDNSHLQMMACPWTAGSRAPLKQQYKTHQMWGCSTDKLNLVLLILSVSDLNQHMPNPGGCDVTPISQSPQVGSRGWQNLYFT